MVYSSFCSCDLKLNHFNSLAQLCPTLCNPVDRSMPGFPVHHQLPEFAQTHVHQVGDAIQPSHQNSELQLLSWLSLPFFCFSKSLQSCPTLCDPIDGSHQAPLSLGFSRQEYEALNKTFVHFDLPFSYFGTKTFPPPTLLSYLGSLKVFKIWSPVWQGGILGGGSVQILILEGGDEHLQSDVSPFFPLPTCRSLQYFLLAEQNQKPADKGVWEMWHVASFGRLVPCSGNLQVCSRQAIEAPDQEGSNQIMVIKSQRLCI